MTNKEIIDIVKALENGLHPQKDIYNILYKHKCYNLCSILNKHFEQNSFLAEQLINKTAVKERYKKCIPIFEKAEFPYAVIKGAALSQTVYHDPFVRISGDIDILVRRQDLDYWKDVFAKNGFVQGRVTNSGIKPFTRQEILFQTLLTHQTAPYVTSTGNILVPYINVDVNTDIMWGECKEKSSMDYVLTHTHTIEMFGNKVVKLRPEMEFVALCLHHYKDINSIFLIANGSYRLGVFCDIYEYLKNVYLNKDMLLEICKNLRVGQYLYACLHLTQEIFNDSTVREYLCLLDPYKDETLCASFGLTEKERKQWGLALLDRLFHPNLSEYLNDILSEDEKNKILINGKLM